MAFSVQRAMWLLVAVYSLVAQAALPNLYDFFDQSMELTETAWNAISNGIQGKKDESSPTIVQYAPGTYAKVEETPKYFTDKGSKRTTLKYGPFSVQSMNESNGMVAFLQLQATMPCSDCMITWMQAGLEYPDGSYANANTSMWLHHTVFINIAHPDTVCGSNYYGKGQRWFASGNERTITNFCMDGEMPAGYYIGSNDYHVIELELMNQEMMPQDAVMTVTYEYVPSKPEDFYSIKPMWLDIAGCEVASDMPPKSNTTFSYHLNQTYSPDWSGAIIGMGGHLHDGGTMLLNTNKGETQCDIAPYYGGPGFIGPSMSGSGMSGMSNKMEHISYMSSCYAPYTGMVQPGDEWGVTADYDFTKHAGMTNTDGTLSDIMGISVLYAAENMTAAEMSAIVGKENFNPNPPQPAAASSLMAGPTGMASMNGMKYFKA